ncbi:PDZ domain-containing protein [Bradyrhizobium sp. UFLA05-153]
MALGAPASGLDLGRRALLGITASPLRAGVDSIGPGVLAERVIAGSSAAQAGVVSGDVVVSVDGKPLGAVDDFLRAVGVHRAGDTVPVELRRAGQLSHLPSSSTAYRSRPLPALISPTTPWRHRPDSGAPS